MGCQQYQASSPDHSRCLAVDNCASCGGSSILKGNCTEVKGYRRWKVSGYGLVTGHDNIKRELMNHKVLACGIELTQSFRGYQGGVFSQITIAPKVNHYVELVGTGTENGQNYWLGRAFFGTSWGNKGYFKIKMGSNVLGIESKCYWIGPVVDK